MRVLGYTDKCVDKITFTKSNIMIILRVPTYGRKLKFYHSYITKNYNMTPFG